MYAMLEKDNKIWPKSWPDEIEFNSKLKYGTMILSFEECLITVSYVQMHQNPFLLTCS